MTDEIGAVLLSLDQNSGFVNYSGTVKDGFVEVWIACQGSNVFVPAENVVG